MMSVRQSQSILETSIHEVTKMMLFIVNKHSEPRFLRWKKKISVKSSYLVTFSIFSSRSTPHLSIENL